MNENWGCHLEGGIAGGAPWILLVVLVPLAPFFCLPNRARWRKLPARPSNIVSLCIISPTDISSLSSILCVSPTCGSSLQPPLHVNKESAILKVSPAITAKDGLAVKDGLATAKDELVAANDELAAKGELAIAKDEFAVTKLEDEIAATSEQPGRTCG